MNDETLFPMLILGTRRDLAALLALLHCQDADPPAALRVARLRVRGVSGIVAYTLEPDQVAESLIRFHNDPLLTPYNWLWLILRSLLGWRLASHLKTLYAQQAALNERHRYHHKRSAKVEQQALF